MHTKRALFRRSAGKLERDVLTNACFSRAVPRANNSDDLLPDFKAIKWNVDRIER